MWQQESNPFLQTRNCFNWVYPSFRNGFLTFDPVNSEYSRYCKLSNNRVRGPNTKQSSLLRTDRKKDTQTPTLRVAEWWCFLGGILQNLMFTRKFAATQGVASQIEVVFDTSTQLASNPLGSARSAHVGESPSLKATGLRHFKSEPCM